MASVGERVLRDGSIRYRVQARENGKNRQTTFLSEQGANEFARHVERVGWASAEAVLEARQRKTQAIPTLREWVTKYLDPASGILTGVEAGTRDGYRQAAERSFLQVLGEMPVDIITKADVGRWVAWQEQQPSQRGSGNVSQKTVRNYHSILSAAMRAAIDAKLRDDNPAWRTRITKGQRKEAVFLSESEFTTLLHFIPDRYTGLVMFLAGTGARWGEATAITWGDLNLRAVPPTVRIDKAWKKAPSGAVVLGPPKSSRSRRTVSLTADVVEAIGTPGAPGELVFRAPGGGQVRYSRFREVVWAPAVEKAQNPALCDHEGLEVLRKSPSIHSLRHTHASWLIAAGVPLPHVQARLGHESINTTVGVYGHLQPDAHAQMAAVVAKALEGARPLRALD